MNSPQNFAGNFEKVHGGHLRQNPALPVLPSVASFIPPEAEKVCNEEGHRGTEQDWKKKRLISSKKWDEWELPLLMSRGGWGELSIVRFFINDPSFKTRRRTLRKKQTDAEYKLWQGLRNKQVHGLKFYRQYSVGSYILDFYCPQRRLAIELDGSQHSAAKEYDDARTAYLQRLRITVIRFWDHEVLQEMDVVMEVIWDKLLKEGAKTANPLLS